MNRVNTVNHPKDLQDKNLTCCQRLYFYENLSENDLATSSMRKMVRKIVSFLLNMAIMIRYSVL